MRNGEGIAEEFGRELFNKYGHAQVYDRINDVTESFMAKGFPRDIVVAGVNSLLDKIFISNLELELADSILAVTDTYSPALVEIVSEIHKDAIDEMERVNLSEFVITNAETKYREIDIPIIEFHFVFKRDMHITEIRTVYKEVMIRLACMNECFRHFDLDPIDIEYRLV